MKAETALFIEKFHATNSKPASRSGASPLETRSAGLSRQRAPRTCAILAIPVQPAMACGAGTLVAAWGVDTAKAAASAVDAALVYIWDTGKGQVRCLGTGSNGRFLNRVGLLPPFQGKKN